MPLHNQTVQEEFERMKIFKKKSQLNLPNTLTQKA